MANFERGYLYKTYDVKVDPDVLVDMISDWVNIYFPSSFPVKLHTVYGEGSEAGRYPCQRLVYVDHSTVPAGEEWPGYFDETLYHVDYEARTLIYSVDKGGGSLNYRACNEIDDLGNGRSRLAYRAHFDLPLGSDVEGYIKGISTAFAALARGYEENAVEFMKNRRLELLKSRRRNRKA